MIPRASWTHHARPTVIKIWRRVSDSNTRRAFAPPHDFQSCALSQTLPTLQNWCLCCGYLLRYLPTGLRTSILVMGTQLTVGPRSITRVSRHKEGIVRVAPRLSDHLSNAHFLRRSQKVTRLKRSDPYGGFGPPSLNISGSYIIQLVCCKGLKNGTSGGT